MFWKNPSLSARRAWIEMVHVSALDGESAASLSARRAWIEMFLFLTVQGGLFMRISALILKIAIVKNSRIK